MTFENVQAPPKTSPLPYTDKKPVGASDFYMAINATFRFVYGRFGLAGLKKYWGDLGAGYFAPVSERWRDGGASEVAKYWRAFFAAEPGGDVAVDETPDTVTIHVKVCPAIKHLRENHREILPSFCQHCYFLNEAIASPAGFTARVKGGNGACLQTFHRREAAVPPQDLADIREAASC